MKDIARKRKQERYKKEKDKTNKKKKTKKEKEIWKEKEKKDLCFKVTLPARDGEKIKILQNWQNI